MKFKKRILYAIFILLILFVTNIFISTGYFRTIENSFEGKILKKIKLPGAEDITISQIDSFAIISSTSRNKFPNTKQEIGGLYFIDLKILTINLFILQKILRNRLLLMVFLFLK